jgi:hypothetical protein
MGAALRIEHWPDPGAEELGVGVDLGQQALVGAAGPPKRLDDLDALDELRGGGADAAHAGVPLGDLLAHAAHHGAVVEGEHRHRDEGDDRQPPVHPEQVGQRGQRGDERGGQLDRGGRDQVVHRGHVVLDGLPDLAGAPVGEPAEGTAPRWRVILRRTWSCKSLSAKCVTARAPPASRIRAASAPTATHTIAHTRPVSAGPPASSSRAISATPANGPGQRPRPPPG